jgi:hypothetical protein
MHTTGQKSDRNPAEIVQKSARNPTARWASGETAAARGEREGWAAIWNIIHHKNIKSWNPPMHVIACFPVYSGVTKPRSVFPKATRDCVRPWGT